MRKILGLFLLMFCIFGKAQRAEYFTEAKKLCQERLSEIKNEKERVAIVEKNIEEINAAYKVALEKIRADERANIIPEPIEKDESNDCMELFEGMGVMRTMVSFVAENGKMTNIRAKGENKYFDTQVEVMMYLMGKHSGASETKSNYKQPITMIFE